MKEFIKKRLNCPFMIFLWLVVCICLSLASLASAEVLRQAMSAIEHMAQNRLKEIVLLAAFITVWSIVFEYLKRIMGQKLRNQSETKLQIFLLKYMLSINKISFSQKSNGTILTLLQDNIVKAVSGSLDVLYHTVYGIGVLLFSAIYMGSLSWQLMLIVIACNIVFRLLTRFFDQKIRTFSKQRIGHVSESNSFFMEVLRNELLVRVYQRRDYFENGFKEKENAVARSGLSIYAIRNGYDEITWFISMLITLVFIYGIGGTFMLQGMLEFSVLMAFTKASDSFVKGINSIIFAINEYNNTLPHIKAIEQELPEFCEKESVVLEKLELGDICFHDVSFAFADKVIFEHLNLTVHQGDQVMVTGINGSGKSTLFGLLLGFYQPQGGFISINGRNIVDYSTEALCELFGYIPQEAHILYGTVEENMALTMPRDTVKTEQIMKQLHLELVENADPLYCSMGEKQRINIGRTLYHETRGILLGDEIFSNIDAGNRNLIQKVLKEFCRNKTVLLICHENFDYPFTHHLHVGEQKVTYTHMTEVTP